MTVAAGFGTSPQLQIDAAKSRVTIGLQNLSKMSERKSNDVFPRKVSRRGRDRRPPCFDEPQLSEASVSIPIFLILSVGDHPTMTRHGTGTMRHPLGAQRGDTRSVTQQASPATEERVH